MIGVMAAAAPRSDRQARPRRPVAALHRRRGLHRRLRPAGHRGAAGVDGQQLPRLVERDGAGDHGNADRPELGEELTESFCRTDPDQVRKKPAIGIVPIGDRFTMGAKSAAFVCKKFFAFDMILPAHYGTFPGMLDPNADKFVAEMSGHNVVVPKVGQALTV